MKYRIWSGEHGLYWRFNSAGYTFEREHAGHYELTEVIAILASVGPEKDLSAQRISP